MTTYDVKKGESNLSLCDCSIFDTYLDYRNDKPRFSNELHPKGRHIFDRKMYEYYAWPETTTWIFTLVYENEQFYVYIQYGQLQKLYSYIRYISSSFNDAISVMHSIIKEQNKNLEMFKDFNEVHLPERTWLYNYEQMISCDSDLSSIENKVQAIHNVSESIYKDGNLNETPFEVICINNIGLEESFQQFNHYYAELFDNDLFIVQDDNGNQIECMQERFESI